MRELPEHLLRTIMHHLSIEYSKLLKAVYVERPFGWDKPVQPVHVAQFSDVNEEDPDEWAKRIRDASMQEPRQRYEDARRLRENYGKTYPWEQACQDFVNLLEEVMKIKGTLKSLNFCLFSQLISYFFSSSNISDSFLPQRSLSIEEKARSEAICTHRTSLKAQITHVVQVTEFRSFQLSPYAPTSSAPRIYVVSV